MWGGGWEGGEQRGYSAKRSSDPKVANPEVKVQVRDLVRVMDIVTPFAPRGVSIPENSFYPAPGGKWAQETCAVVGHGRARQSSGTGPCGDCRGVVGIVVPFAPRGLFGENSIYRAPRGEWAQETCVGCPQQRHVTEEPGKVQGRDPVGIVEWSCVYLAHGSSILGKFVLSRNPQYKTMGIDMWLNVVLTPGSLPRSQSSGTGPIGARCGYCCPLCPTGSQYSGKFRFIEPRG